jgi:hypothetical protein
MNKLDETLTKEIIKYLSNEDVFKIEKLNTFYNNLYDLQFKCYIKYRKHPMVFNVFDNICKTCNMEHLFILQQNMTFIRCCHN